MCTSRLENFEGLFMFETNIFRRARVTQYVGLGCKINKQFSNIATCTKFQDFIHILGHYRYFFYECHKASAVS